MSDRIEYEFVEGRRGVWRMKVALDGIHVGNIKLVTGGFAYFPKGQKRGGKVFKTVREVQQDLEGGDNDN